MPRAAEAGRDVYFSNAARLRTYTHNITHLYGKETIRRCERYGKSAIHYLSNLNYEYKTIALNGIIPNLDDFSPNNNWGKYHGYDDPKAKSLINFFLKNSEENYCDDHGYTYLHGACFSGDIETVQRFVSQGVDVDVDSFTYSPLHIACKYRRVDVVKVLLESGAEPNRLDKEDKSTPLHALARLRVCDCAEFCTDNIDDDKIEKKRRPVDEIVNLLVAKGANIETRNARGFTPLESAVSLLDYELTKSLLERGASLDSLSENIVFSTDYTSSELKNYPITLYIAELIRLLSSNGFSCDVYTRLKILKFFMKYRNLDIKNLITDNVGESSHRITSLLHSTYNALFLPLYKVELLRGLRNRVNWQVAQQRHAFLNQIDYLLTRDPTSHLLDVRDFLSTEQIECLLWDSIYHEDGFSRQKFIEFVARSGYRDQFDGLDEDGRPLVRRDTPLHLLRHECVADCRDTVRHLFIIYERFDVNYVDKDGYTHFHVACRFGCEDVVENFLDAGQVDANLIEAQTGYSPLFLALDDGLHAATAELLLRRGADPNVGDSYGCTPLHLICRGSGGYDDDDDDDRGDDLIRLLFERSHDRYRPVRVDAREEIEKNTPLHYALKSGRKKISKSLLSRGADPNLTDAKESTSLHIICERYVMYSDDDLMKIFFEMTDELGLSLNVDARDEKGRTPLQLAVANVYPNTARALLDRGADLTKFVFPDKNHFDARLNLNYGKTYLLKLAAGLLAIVEDLEKRGYELDRSDAITIVKVFLEHELFEKSTNLENPLLLKPERLGFGLERLWLFNNCAFYAAYPVLDAILLKTKKKISKFVLIFNKIFNSSIK
ncbi:unnamed protein product [Trichogramma brassicae]|uniref:Uncharacterized protein n=1 Tax=Trichogramma brassicae TaxID=86971 RepID=A0A6H5ITF7_9HYME|nr:unnamed protein product [Trichogramma brassicae]